MSLLLPDPRPRMGLEQTHPHVDDRRGVIVLARLGVWSAMRQRCLVLTKPYWLGLTSRAGAPWSPSSGRPSRRSAMSTPSARASSVPEADPPIRMAGSQRQSVMIPEDRSHRDQSTARTSSSPDASGPRCLASADDEFDCRLSI